MLHRSSDRIRERGPSPRAMAFGRMLQPRDRATRAPIARPRSGRRRSDAGELTQMKTKAAPRIGRRRSTRDRHRERSTAQSRHAWPGRPPRDRTMRPLRFDSSHRPGALLRRRETTGDSRLAERMSAGSSARHGGVSSGRACPKPTTQTRPRKGVSRPRGRCQNRWPPMATGDSTSAIVASK